MVPTLHLKLYFSISILLNNDLSTVSLMIIQFFVVASFDVYVIHPIILILIYKPYSQLIQTPY